MGCDYRPGDLVPEEKLGVVKKYCCGYDVSCAKILGDTDGTYSYCVVEATLESFKKPVEIPIPINDFYE